MKTYARGAAAVIATAVALTATAAPQAAVTSAPGSTQQVGAAAGTDVNRRDASVVIGIDIGEMIKAPGPDVDLAAFKAALEAAIDGKPPLISEADAGATHELIMGRIKERVGGGKNAQPLSTSERQRVGQLVGLSIGRSLVPFRGEIDLDQVVATVADIVAGKAAPIVETRRNEIRQAFLERMRIKIEAQRQLQATANREQGATFLADNKTKKGVFTTPSGLQYMVLRQGAGARPKPSDKVRVNYEGTLLDGTVFDSSYARNEPAEFMLNQVIPGWTEGVAMMPVGAKYRFWVPSQLGYGERGAGGQIGPNATLVFDVELLAISQ